MATISVIKDAIRICRYAKITPFVWGHSGLGKSSLVSQVCAEDHLGFIDLRCSQLESSDVRGLPDRAVCTDSGIKRTVYLPPADMPSGDLTFDQVLEIMGPMPDQHNPEALRQYNNKLVQYQPRLRSGILFLDELNRAQDDVLQSFFQLILDGRVGQYVLPPEWMCVAAGNYMEGYQVSGFNDPAFLNRFCHLVLSHGETTLEEWVNYISTIYGPAASDVIEFASQNPDHLDGKREGDLGFSITPSRRSWEKVIKVQEVCEKHNFSRAAYQEVLAGLIGRDLSLSFARYSCPVKPKDLLTHGVDKYHQELTKLSRNQLTGLMWGLVGFCKARISDPEVAKVCLDFAEFTISAVNDKDIVVAFCRAFVTGNGNDNQERTRAAVICNPTLAGIIAKFNAAAGNKEKGFVDWLNERPKLQQILSHVSWGSSDDK